MTNPYDVRILKANGEEFMPKSLRTWADNDEQAIAITRDDYSYGFKAETIVSVTVENGEVIVRTTLEY